MNTLKSLGKKFTKLEASMRKDAKRLTKLKRKLEAAEAIAKAKTSEAVPTPAKAQPKPRSAARPKSAAAKAPAKKKRTISPATRAKLSALMNARWAAKRAEASNSSGQQSPSPETQA